MMSDMKNADMPVMPLVKVTEESSYNGCKYIESKVAFNGLTKREHFAGLAMQAYISGNMAWSDGLDGGSVSPSFEEAAAEAVCYADALLAELEKGGSDDTNS